MKMKRKSKQELWHAKKLRQNQNFVLEKFVEKI